MRALDDEFDIMILFVFPSSTSPPPTCSAAVRLLSEAEKAAAALDVTKCENFRLGSGVVVLVLVAETAALLLPLPGFNSFRSQSRISSSIASRLVDAPSPLGIASPSLLSDSATTSCLEEVEEEEEVATVAVEVAEESVPVALRRTCDGGASASGAAAHPTYSSKRRSSGSR